jgi:hypothetical protein
MSQQVIEWAPFRKKAGVDDATLLKLSDGIQQGFLEKQKGYRRRELLKSKQDGEFVDVIWWESLEDAERAAKLVNESETCTAYFAAMDFDPADTGAQPLHFRIVRDWDR